VAKDKEYIKSFRKLIDNPVVWKDNDHLAMWIYLLHTVNWSPSDTMFDNKRITLNPGQGIYGRKSLALKLRISESKCERVLTLFKNEQQIEQQTSSKNRLITIVNWSSYQKSEQPNGQQVDNKRTTSGQPVDTLKEYKELKNNKNTNKEGNDVIVSPTQKSSYGEFTNVKLTIEEYEKIKSSRLESYIAKLSAYKESTGKRYKSDYATILNWSRKDGEGKRVEPIPTYESTSKPMTREEIEALKKRLKGNGEPK